MEVCDDRRTDRIGENAEAWRPNIPSVFGSHGRQEGDNGEIFEFFQLLLEPRKLAQQTLTSNVAQYLYELL